ncbi:MAG: NADH-quinone oxidoreductase subunit NuoK [Planctomycetota bacterium]
MIFLQHYLVLSAALFCLGLYIVLTRKNAVAILMGIELILNAASISFVAFSRYISGAVTGQIFVIFIIIIAVCEAVVALAIILNIYQNFRSVDTDKTNELKG